MLRSLHIATLRTAFEKKLKVFLKILNREYFKAAAENSYRCYHIPFSSPSSIASANTEFLSIFTLRLQIFEAHSWVGEEKSIEAPAIVVFTIHSLQNVRIQHRIQFSFIIKPLTSLLALQIIRCILNTFEHLLWLWAKIKSANMLKSLVTWKIYSEKRLLPNEH